MRWAIRNVFSSLKVTVSARIGLDGKDGDWIGAVFRMAGGVFSSSRLFFNGGGV